MSFFTVSHLFAGYGNRPVIRDLSFSLGSGRVMGLLGSNGSGKTTLMKAICGILPHGGRCTLDGIPLEGLPSKKLAQRCGYIPQRSGISIDISVLDVVLMGFNPWLGLLEHPNEYMKASARETLSLVGLEKMEEENYLHLSEGQKQLCILARTLVSKTSLLLLDEPESALDFYHRYRMLRTLRTILQTENRCALISLHDPILALNHCDDLLLLEEGRCLGILHPKEDSLEDMEAQLSRLYGPVTLAACRDKTGRSHLIMLNQQEDTL